MNMRDMLAIIDTMEQQLKLLRQEIERDDGAESFALTGEIEATSKRATRLAARWEPMYETIDWARASFPNVEIQYETDRFRDYHTSKGSSFKNWDAAYRNWIRKASKFSKASIHPLQGGSAGRAAALSEANRVKREGALDKLASLQQGTARRKA